MYLECPNGCGRIEIDEKTYRCQCATIWKEKSGREITPDIVITLLKYGRTGILNGFVNRAGEPFSSALELKDGKVVFASSVPEEQLAKVTSSSSGQVYLFSEGIIDTSVNYGLMPVREAVCLGCITLASLVKNHYSKLPKLSLVLSNKESVQYLLREKTPKNLAVKNTLQYLWTLLDEFPSWQIQFQPDNKGASQPVGPRQDEFPRGIFPGIQIELAEGQDKNRATVLLPGRPDVICQFAACFPKGEKSSSSKFVIPGNYTPMVKAWLFKVKNSN